MDEGDRIPIGHCDRHAGIPAATLWERDTQTLALCRNCCTLYSQSLRRGGWTTTAHNPDAWQTSPA